MAKHFTLGIKLTSRVKTGIAVADVLRQVSYEIADLVDLDTLDAHHSGTIYDPGREKIGTWKVTGQ